MQARHSGRTRNNSIPAAQAIALATVIGVFSPEAHGADLTLDSLNDVIPSVLAAGVTIYGTVDVGGAYSSHGVSASGAFYPGADYTIFGSRFAGPAIATMTNNALEQSKIGVKIEESFGDGWAAIGKLETGFNPISGELSDACASLLRNNGKLYSQMDNNGDGSRCGQAFNSVAYGGVSNASYGTLTAGRQQSLMLDGLATYDPMALSYAFSVLGYSGTPAARHRQHRDRALEQLGQVCLSVRPNPCRGDVQQRRPGHADDGPGLWRQYWRRLSGLLD